VRWGSIAIAPTSPRYFRPAEVVLRVSSQMSKNGLC
jgi:hypothetical protein